MYQIKIQLEGGEGVSLESQVAQLDTIKADILAGHSSHTTRSAHLGYSWEVREVDSSHLDILDLQLAGEVS